jgi:RNA polymerase sigma factor (sigma-70 family)
MTETKRPLILIDVDDAYVVRRYAPLSDGVLVQDISVPASGLTDVALPGKKCLHGVYIPSNSPMQDRAEYCSVCNWYVCRLGKAPSMDLNEAYDRWMENPIELNREIFGRELLGYVSGYVRQQKDIQEDIRADVIADAIARVLAEIGKYNPNKSSFKTWAGRKTIDTIATALKEVSERQEYPLFETNPAPNLYRRIDGRIDAKARLKRLMEALSIDECRQIRLHLEGHEAIEIAKILGISDEAAWKRWERIKEKMRKSNTECQVSPAFSGQVL